MKILVLMLLYSACGLAQITASFQPQPVSTFKAVFGSANKKLTLFEVEICNAGSNMGVVHAGAIQSVAQEKGIPTLSPLLVSSVILSARNHSILRAVLDTSKWVALAATVLTGSDLIAANTAFRAALPLVAQSAPLVSEFLAGRIIDPISVQEGMLHGLIQVGPGSCESRLMLASVPSKTAPIANSTPVVIKSSFSLGSQVSPGGDVSPQEQSAPSDHSLALPIALQSN